MAEADSFVAQDIARAAPATCEKSHARYNVTARYVNRTTTLEQSQLADTPASVAATKAAQLQALLHMTYGEGRSAFDSMCGDLRESLMWLAADLAKDVRVLTELESLRK